MDKKKENNNVPLVTLEKCRIAPFHPCADAI